MAVKDLSERDICTKFITPALVTAPVELLRSFGGRDGFERAVHELQSALYAGVA